MKQKKRLNWILPLILVVLVLGVALPIPYYIESPGDAVSLSKMVTVDHQEDKEKGRFMLTTVAIRRATPFLYFMRFLPFHEGVTKAELYGEVESNQEFNNLQQYYMTSSVNSAIELAFKTAGENYQTEYNGVYVMSITKNSKFKNLLQPGDTIISLNNQRFKSSKEFIDYVKKQKIGETIQVKFKRQGIEKTVKAPLIEMEADKKAGLGISLVDDTTIKTDIPVDVNTDKIGGPSAGMMFTLEIYSQLKQQDLRRGREIAGTGTIAPDGTVGRIGGIDKKVVAASKEGATIFFAPDDEIDPAIKKKYPTIKTNYEEAKLAAEKINTKMKIVPIKTFQDAITYLEK